MSEVNVKNQNNVEKEEKALDKRSTNALASWLNWDPFKLSLTPADLYSSNPFALMPRISKEIDRAFERFFGQGSSTNPSTWFPAIEVSKQDGHLLVHAELPGLKPEDVK